MRDLIPFVSRARYDRLWRENVELRNALKNANEDRRKLRIIVEDARFPRPAAADTAGTNH